MRTHSDLTSGSSACVTKEQCTEVCTYVRKMVEAFASTCQLQISFDGSSYGEGETLVTAAYDRRLDLGAFLPIQDMKPVLTKELHPDIQVPWQFLALFFS